MSKYLYFILTLTLLISCSETIKQEEVSPNFIFILADDLGYGEIGIQGQKWIETPHIDALAREGMILTDHYMIPLFHLPWGGWSAIEGVDP